MSEAQVFIDEIDVTNYAVEGSSTRNLNRPSTAQVKLPMDVSIGGANSLLKIYFDGVLHHHGKVLLCEVSPQTDTGYTVYNSTDGFELWAHRPVRDPGTAFTSSCGKTQPVDDPGDFSDPDLIQDFLTGPEIVEAMMFASQNESAPGGVADAEGPLYLANGTFACGGVDLTGAPVDWPMTMAQLATLLVSTGELDIVITPIELDGNGNWGQLDAYNGDYGDNLVSSVQFQYGMGAYNIQMIRWNEDMTNMANKLWYFLGQKVAQQRWPANITGTSNFSVPCGFNAAVVQAKAGSNTFAGGSRGVYGTRMDIKIFDADAAATTGYCIYQKMWLQEQWLRATPLRMYHITPTRDAEIGAFDIGDIVLVECTTEVKGGFSGGQRVYGYTISWDASDSVPSLSELQTSADNEGFSA